LLISEESTELRWFDVDALPEGMMPSSRMRVLDTLQRRVEAFSKQGNGLIVKLRDKAIKLSNRGTAIHRGLSRTCRVPLL